MTVLLLALAHAAAPPIRHGMSVVDSAAGPLVGLPGGVAIDPATGAKGQGRYFSDYPGKGLVVPVPGTDARSPLLRYVPDGVVAWDAATGRDLGRVLPVDAREAVLTPDAAVAVVRTPSGIEGWSTATGKRLWTAPDPFPADTVVPWWRIAGGGVAVPTYDAVWLLDPATGEHAWTLTREGDAVRLVGKAGSCLVTAGGIREGTCPPFTPTPAPLPAPGPEATDPLAVLQGAGPTPNERLVARYRAREAAPWPEAAGPASPAKVHALTPGTPLPAPAEDEEEPLVLPLRAGRPTLVVRGDGDDWPSCDTLWIDPPAKAREPGGYDRARLELGTAIVPKDGDPVTAFVSEPEAAARFGLGPGEALLVDAEGLVRWRGASGEDAEAACRLVLGADGETLPTRAAATRWAYRPPTPTPAVVAVEGGVVAWGQRGLVVLDEDGRVRWTHTGRALSVSVGPDRVVIVEGGREPTRVARALDDGREVPEGDPIPPPRAWSAVGDGGRVEPVADGPLAWFVGDVAIAWVPGRPWACDVRGRRGYAWSDGAIVAWEAP